MAWRIAVLTYPIWGSFVALGLCFRLLPPGPLREAAFLPAVLLALATPLPVWTSARISVLGKVLLTCLLYIYAYVAFFIMRFGIACAVFKFSCGLG